MLPVIHLGLHGSPGSAATCQYSYSSITTPPRGFLGGSVVKDLPAMWEIWVQSLVQEDPLEESVATHSNILAQEIE